MKIDQVGFRFYRESEVSCRVAEAESGSGKRKAYLGEVRRMSEGCWLLAVLARLPPANELLDAALLALLLLLADGDLGDLGRGPDLARRGEAKRDGERNDGAGGDDLLADDWERRPLVSDENHVSRTRPNSPLNLASITEATGQFLATSNTSRFLFSGHPTSNFST